MYSTIFTITFVSRSLLTCDPVMGVISFSVLCTVYLSLIWGGTLAFLFLFSLIKLWPNKLRMQVFILAHTSRPSLSHREGVAAGAIMKQRVTNAHYCWAPFLHLRSPGSQAGSGDAHGGPSRPFVTLLSSPLSYSPSLPFVCWLYVLPTRVRFIWFCTLAFHFLVLFKILGLFLLILVCILGVQYDLLVYVCKMQWLN